MILIKTLFLNLIPEEVTVVEPEALVGVVVNLFYVFIFVYRTWIVAPAVLVVNKERLSPLATKLLPTHLIDRNRHHLLYIITVDAEAIVGLVTKVSSSRDVFQSNSALPAINLHLYLPWVCHKENEYVVPHCETAYGTHNMTVPSVLRASGVVLLFDKVERVENEDSNTEFPYERTTAFEDCFQMKIIERKVNPRYSLFHP